jgi:hypothetical protein
MTDPGYLAYVIAESSFVRTVKDMKHIRTEVCRKLPSGTNEQGWLEIFKKCTISRGRARETPGWRLCVDFVISRLC